LILGSVSEHSTAYHGRSRFLRSGAWREPGIPEADVIEYLGENEKDAAQVVLLA